MADVYLDPIIIVVAVAVVMIVIGFFDFASRGKRPTVEPEPIS